MALSNCAKTLICTCGADAGVASRLKVRSAISHWSLAPLLLEEQKTGQLPL